MPKHIEVRLKKYAAKKYPGKSPAAQARRNNYVYGTLSKRFGFVKGGHGKRKARAKAKGRKRK